MGVFDYTKPGVVEHILEHVKSLQAGIPYILDCTGSVQETIESLSHIA